MKWLLKLLGFHVHQWSKWEIIQVSGVASLDKGTWKKAHWNVQRRTCATCGKVQEQDV